MGQLAMQYEPQIKRGSVIQRKFRETALAVRTNQQTGALQSENGETEVGRHVYRYEFRIFCVPDHCRW